MTGNGLDGSGSNPGGRKESFSFPRPVSNVIVLNIIFYTFLCSLCLKFYNSLLTVDIALFACKTVHLNTAVTQCFKALFFNFAIYLSL